MKAAEKFASVIAPEGFLVRCTQDTLYIQSFDVAGIFEIKKIVARFLKKVYPTRTYKHAKRSSSVFWKMASGETRVGIRIVRTHEERRSMLLGPAKDINY